MRFTSLFAKRGRFAGDRRGTAAVEFAVMAPVFLLSLLAMADVGIAFSEQMNLDQAVRTGAEFAATGMDDFDELEELVAAAATGYNSDDADDVGVSRPTVVITEVCRCPGTEPVVSCSATCASGQPSHFYSLTASKSHDAMFLSEFNLQATIQVQVR